jgi:hypothetical protein
MGPHVKITICSFGAAGRKELQINATRRKIVITLK